MCCYQSAHRTQVKVPDFEFSIDELKLSPLHHIITRNVIHVINTPVQYSETAADLRFIHSDTRACHCIIFVGDCRISAIVELQNTQIILATFFVADKLNQSKRKWLFIKNARCRRIRWLQFQLLAFYKKTLQFHSINWLLIWKRLWRLNLLPRILNIIGLLTLCLWYSYKQILFV